jgi:CarboxypepD_reg-like domain/TonB dependent receptor/TonB-dependent Receptor Plug Domain
MKIDIRKNKGRFIIVFLLILSLSYTNAQLPEKKASLYYGKIRLELALVKLKEIYSINFSYGNTIPLNRLVELNAFDKTLKEVLDEILPKIGITYKLIGNIISLRPIEQKQSIRGKVIDKISGEALIGVNIVILDVDTLVGSSTDMEGAFLIREVKVGRYSLMASFIGYENAIISDVVVTTGNEPFVMIGMKESVINLKEVTVRPGQLNGQPLNNFSLSGGRSFSAEETRRFASNFNDPARMVTAFPGINATNDASNSMAIRGNSPNGMQWRLEGIEIPSPSHFAAFGGSGGAISMLSLNMIDNSDFFSGAFPAEYGNALSGVMDMKLRRGNNQKSEKSFQVGVIGVDLAAEGPFRKGRKSSYLLNYRYSTLGLLENLGLFSKGAVPKYQDLSFNLSFPKGNQSTNIWGIVGDGIIHENTGVNSNNVFNTKNAMGGITYKKNFNTSSSFVLATLASVSRDKLINEYAISQSETIESNFRNNVSQSFRISPQFNKKFSSQSALRAGIVFSYQHYKLSNSFVDFTNNLKKETPLDARGGTGYLQFYGQWKKYISDKIALNTGLHNIFFLLNRHYSVEPRIGLSYEISSVENIAIAAGLHSRMQPLNLYYEELHNDDGAAYYPNRNLDFSKAVHYAISYDRMIGERFHLRAETYYQYLFNIPVYYTADAPVRYTSYSAINQVNEYLNTDMEEDLPFPLVNSGKGTNYGLELTLEKFFSKDYYFLLTNSLYQSKYRGSDHIERNTLFNGQYIFTALAGKEIQTGIGKNNTVEFNARVSWSGNNRQTPINIAESWVSNTVVYDYDKRYTERLPDYFRFDFHVGFRINKAKAAHIWSFDIRNASNRLNARAKRIDYQNYKITYSTQLGIVPVLSYRIEF